MKHIAVSGVPPKVDRPYLKSVGFKSGVDGYKRNLCAHPSSFSPGLNDALGYISEVLHYFRLQGA